MLMNDQDGYERRIANFLVWGDDRLVVLIQRQVSVGEVRLSRLAMIMKEELLFG